MVPARDHARGGRLFDPSHLTLAERNGLDPARLAAGNFESHLAAEDVRATDARSFHFEAEIAGPARQVGHGRRRTGGKRRHAEGHHVHVGRRVFAQFTVSLPKLRTPPATESTS